MMLNDARARSVRYIVNATSARTSESQLIAATLSKNWPTASKNEENELAAIGGTAFTLRIARKRQDHPQRTLGSGPVAAHDRRPGAPHDPAQDERHEDRVVEL